VRVIIAEDSLLVREGIVSVLSRLGHQVAATATRAEQVLGLVNRHHPDLVLLDIRMPPTHTDEGIRLAVIIRARHPRVGILVLSQYADPGHAATLVEQAGTAVGYLLKDRLLDDDVLGDALRRIADNRTAIDPELVATLIRRPRPASALDGLTPRERDVLSLMAEGLSDKGIAGRLSVTTATVSTHVQAVFRKLDLPDSTVDNRRVLAVLSYLRQH
jgi:DNA-binding NarL/FixJ family response regulator